MARTITSIISSLKKRKDVAPEFKRLRPLTFQGCASYGAVFYEKGDNKYNFEYTANTACHAALSSHHINYGVNEVRGDIVAGINAFRYNNNNHDEKSVRRFLEWFLNYSPYAPAWHTKSPNTAMKNGYLIANPEAQCNIYVGAHIATRSLWEYSEVSMAWHGLVERGMNPNLAFVLAHHLGGTKKKIVRSGHSNHMAITSSQIYYGEGNGANKNYFLNFITNSPKEDKPYKENPNYSGRIHTTWTNLRKEVKGDIELDKAWGLIKQAGKNNKENANPFAGAGVDSYPIELVGEVLTPFYHEMFKKWI